MLNHKLYNYTRLLNKINQSHFLSSTKMLQYVKIYTLYNQILSFVFVVYKPCEILL